MQLGFFGALTIVFVALKLLGIVTWNWIWVLAPLWGGFLLIFFIHVALLSIMITLRK